VALAQQADVKKQTERRGATGWRWRIEANRHHREEIKGGKG